MNDQFEAFRTELLTNIKSDEVRTTNRKLVGRFSYNGRFWNPQGKEVVLGAYKEAA